MTDYTFVKGSDESIVGMWLRDPKVALDQTKTLELLIKHKYESLSNEFSPMIAGEHAPLGLAAATGRYRVVPNNFDDYGGCFVMFGTASAPGEEVTPEPGAKTFEKAVRDFFLLGETTGSSTKEQQPLKKGQDPNNPSTYYIGGNIHIKSARTYFDSGEENYELKKFEEALTDFKQAIQLDPTYAEAHLKASVVLCEYRKFQEALAYAEAAKKLGNQDAAKLVTILKKALGK